MHDRVVRCSDPKQVNSLKYVLVEHSGVGPTELIEHLLAEAGFGVLLLGLDGPHLISSSEAADVVRGLQAGGIRAEIRDSFPWVPAVEFLRLQQKEWTCEGDAALFTQEIHLQVQPKTLPQLRGFNKDKLSAASVDFLDAILSANAVYLQDDFCESLVVTKSEDVLSQMLSEIREFSQGHG